jgi:hypothetical protein
MDTLTLNTLSLPELKQLAKARRIKQYYIIKRAELIRILSMPELPQSFVIEKLTIRQLRKQAKEKEIKGLWSLTREELIGLLYPAAAPLDEKNQNCNNPNQDTPQYDSDCKKVWT